MRLGELILRGLRRTASLLPPRAQRVSRRISNSWQIRYGKFSSPEPEFDMLSRWVKRGDWVLDIGANVGHYTLRLAELVASTGHVIAFEPVPETFAILTANCAVANRRNITLINAAASATASIVHMSIPRYPDGLPNFYQAHIDQSGTGADRSADGFTVLALPIDAALPAQAIAFIKIDAEGHEASVLDGLRRIIEVHMPVILMENTSGAAAQWLNSRGYELTSLEDSPNVICLHTARNRAAPGDRAASPC